MNKFKHVVQFFGRAKGIPYLNEILMYPDPLDTTLRNNHGYVE